LGFRRGVGAGGAKLEPTSFENARAYKQDYPYRNSAEFLAIETC